jgi:hypothetical protein
MLILLRNLKNKFVHLHGEELFEILNEDVLAMPASRLAALLSELLVKGARDGSLLQAAAWGLW